MREPDYGSLFCILRERYRATFDEIGDLTWSQVRAMIRHIELRPGVYTILIEPTKH